VVSRSSSGSQDARAASAVVFSALTDTPVLGGAEEGEGCRAGGAWVGPPAATLLGDGAEPKRLWTYLMRHLRWMAPPLGIATGSGEGRIVVGGSVALR